MKVLHIAAGNRWTGAAAPAFAEVEALREAGIEAHYAYVGGYKLEAKIGHLDYAHAIVAKAQNPASFLRTAAELERLINGHRFDIVHAHLTYDHALARYAARRGRAAVARTFHSRRTLRRDPFTRALMSRTAGTFVINRDLLHAPLLDRRAAVVTPPPLDRRLFHPDGPDVRSAYGVGSEPLIAVIGKLSKERGFEAALDTFARVQRSIPEARLMVIGHGEHRPALEARAAGLGIAARTIWAGYHEDDLPEHYRAADVLLFTAAGSDEGHRAVIEAMGCGVPPATYPIEGMSTVLAELSSRFTAGAADPDALAAIVTHLVRSDRGEMRSLVTSHAERFTFGPAARRLADAYTAALQTTTGHGTIGETR